MIESNASLSNEPIDLLEQVDLVAILKSRIPEEAVNTEGNIQLIEIEALDSIIATVLRVFYIKNYVLHFINCK